MAIKDDLRVYMPPPTEEQLKETHNKWVGKTWAEMYDWATPGWRKTATPKEIKALEEDVITEV